MMMKRGERETQGNSQAWEEEGLACFVFSGFSKSAGYEEEANKNEEEKSSGHACFFQPKEGRI